MEKTLILVSGMPGTGKTTFANYLANELHIPLVCYDQIKSKEWDSIHSNLEGMNALSMFGKLSYDFFWFFCETLMKSNSLLIAEYFFHPLNQKMLDELISQYDYKTITVHFDADIKVAYTRFVERNKSQERHQGLKIKDIDYETFAEGVMPNKKFTFGEHMIVVNTNDFANVVYEDIKKQIRSFLEFI